jgi:hypothetical protein
MVEAYSTMRLTKASDKLPVIAGLASEIAHEQQNTRYLAGLWSDSLLTDLLWFVLHNEYHEPEASYRRNQWRAPSWSWASIDAEVTLGPV